MALRSKSNNHPNWPNVASPYELPNVSGASIQDNDLEIGDVCFSNSDSTFYTCIDETLGAAVWTIGDGSNLYFVDPDCADQSVSSSCSSVTTIISNLSTDEEAILVFRNLDSPTTDYVFATDFTWGTNADKDVTFLIQRGARFLQVRQSKT